MQEQDLTTGSIPKQLWSLAWPMMLSVFFYTLYNLVDAFWVSKLSAEAIAAVSISQIALFIMISLGFGINVGSGVIMAMDIGAKNKDEAERVLGQSFVLAAIAGLFFTTIALTFKKQLLVLSGASGLVFAPALEYFTITAAGSIFFFILGTIMFAFNSQGDTFTLTKLFAVSTLINLIMDPILIFGKFGFPAMGISGAAIATIISQIVFIIISIYTLSSKSRHIRFHFNKLSLKGHSVKKVLIIGIPAALTQVVNPIGMAALMFITTTSFQEAGAVAFSLGYRIEFFAFLPAVGFGFGGMSMISQNIGAGNFDRAKRAFKLSLKYGFLAATGIGILAAIFAKNIIYVFTADPVVTDYTLLYIWTVALTYGFLAAMMIEATAFQAIGKSWPGFWIFLIRFAGVSIPLGYILTSHFHLPIIGVWIAVIAGNIISSLVGYLWINKSISNIKPEEIPVTH